MNSRRFYINVRDHGSLSELKKMLEVSSQDINDKFITSKMIKDQRGMNALGYAYALGDVKKLSLLLEYGASAYGEMFQRPHPSYECLKIIFEKNAISANCLINGMMNTLLHKMVCVKHLSNRLKIIEMLVERGADVNSKTIDGYTPLGYAIKYGNSKQNVINYLLRNGAYIHGCGWNVKLCEPYLKRRQSLENAYIDLYRFTLKLFLIFDQKLTHNAMLMIAYNPFFSAKDSIIITDFFLKRFRNKYFCKSVCQMLDLTRTLNVSEEFSLFKTN